MLLFYIGFIFAFFLGALVHESVLFFNLHKKLKNNREYIYKYLMVNNKNETLEHYTLKKFFPKYFIFLIVFLIGYLIAPFITTKILLIIGGISILVIGRIYNRNIFQNIWNVLK